MSVKLEEAKIEANKRFDEALLKYATGGATEKQACELKAAAEALNKAIDAAKAAEKEEGKTPADKLAVDLITAADYEKYARECAIDAGREISKVTYLEDGGICIKAKGLDFCLKNWRDAYYTFFGIWALNRANKRESA